MDIEKLPLKTKTPAELLKSITENLNTEAQRPLIVPLLNHGYQDWSGALALQGGFDRPHPLLPDVEEPLFRFFCAQLRVEGLEISPTEETEAFQDLMKD